MDSEIKIDTFEKAWALWDYLNFLERTGVVRFGINHSFTTEISWSKSSGNAEHWRMVVSIWSNDVSSLQKYKGKV